MALVNCAECGAQISNQAASCIKCGATISASASQPKKGAKRNLLASGLIGVCVMAVMYAVNHRPSQPVTASTAQTSTNAAPDSAPVSSSSDGSGISGDVATFIPFGRQMDGIRKSIITATNTMLDDLNKEADLRRQKDPKAADYLADAKKQINTIIASLQEAEALQLPRFQDARHIELAQNALDNFKSFTHTKRAEMMAFGNRDFDEMQRLDNQAYIKEGEFTHSVHLMNQSLGLEPAQSK